MDGNGRWAMRQRLSRLRGHEAGVEAIRRMVEAAPKQGVGTLTLYAFSSDNWRRPKAEVIGADGAAAFLSCQRGREPGAQRRPPHRDRPSRSLARTASPPRSDAPRAATAGGDALHLRIAVDYSARDAILNAVAGPRKRGDLTRENFSALVTGEAGLRDVDLVIRTSGEKRLSDFLLWESAYAELHFTERMWPDFEPTISRKR